MKTSPPETLKKNFLNINKLKVLEYTKCVETKLKIWDSKSTDEKTVVLQHILFERRKIMYFRHAKTFVAPQSIKPQIFSKEVQY